VLPCGGLRNPDEKIPIPNAAEPFAWARLFPVWRKLEKRRMAEANKTSETVTSNAMDEMLWNEAQVRGAQFTEWLKREPIDSDMFQFLGLQSGDLDSLIIESNDERFTGVRKKNWRDIHDRRRLAFSRLSQMTTAQKMAVPGIMHSRRLTDVVNGLLERVNTIEQKVQWIDERNSALEAKFITNKH